MASEMIFEYFFANLSFRFQWQPIKFSSLDKNILKSAVIEEKKFKHIESESMNDPDLWSFPIQKHT